MASDATRRGRLKPSSDPSVCALVEAGTEVCAIFGKSSTLQVKEVLRTSLEENLKMIEETVAWLRGQGKRVIYDAEHFFDGYRLESPYALQTLQAVVKCGTATIGLCRANRGSRAWPGGGAGARVRGRAG